MGILILRVMIKKKKKKKKSNILNEILNNYIDKEFFFLNDTDKTHIMTFIIILLFILRNH